MRTWENWNKSDTTLLKKHHQKAMSDLVWINKFLNTHQSRTNIPRGWIKTRLEIAPSNLLSLWWSWSGAPTHLATYTSETPGRMESVIAFQHWLGGTSSGSWKLGGLSTGKHITLSRLMHRDSEWEVLMVFCLFSRKPVSHRFQVFKKDIKDFYKIINRPYLVVSSKASNIIYMHSHKEVCSRRNKGNFNEPHYISVCVCV